MPRVAERYSKALITGAGSGLGKAFAGSLMKEGIAVWGTARNPESLTPEELFTPVKLDLAQDQDLREWFKHWDTVSGGFDLVINNAGYSTLGPFENHSASDIDNQLRVLLSGPMQLAGVATACMRKRKVGCLVNVSSVAGLMPIPFMSVYNAAKAGLSAFSQSLMLERPEEAPWVIDFRPGDYQTSFNRNMRKLQGGEADPGIIWQRMESLMENAPVTRRAAEDLMTALGKFRHRTCYSGSFVQTSIASLASRLLPDVFKRMLLRRYYNLT